MIERPTFYARLAVCKRCDFWQGVCRKGHALQSSLGCPLKKFPGVEGAGYLEDMPAPVAEVPGPAAVPCCGGAVSTDAALKPLTWMEVWQQLAHAVEDWQKQGFPLASAEAYAARIAVCRACPRQQYRWFQCQHCKCIVYVKAKLATGVCPYDLWPKA